jgi:hypothetical protein
MTGLCSSRRHGVFFPGVSQACLSTGSLVFLAIGLVRRWIRSVVIGSTPAK